MMQTLKLSEIHALFAAQGVPRSRHYATKCPICGTVQSMASLVKAGADPETVDRYFGFTCEGRFSGAGPWNPSKKRAQVRGCDWTLGGLFQLHNAIVEYDDGTTRPMFQVATPAEAQALVKDIGA